MNFKTDDQLEKAKLEDVLVELLYGKYKELVFHGGTAIWRCYSGNRFSRDIDFYIGGRTEAGPLLTEISDFLKERGYDGKTRTMHLLVESTTKMKIDLNLKPKKGAPVEYTRVDGSKMVVLSLTPEELLEEKIEACEDKRRGGGFKQAEVQDFYDIYHLTALCSRKPQTARRLAALIEEAEKDPPRNVRSLDHLILSGAAPSFEFMVKKIKEWAHEAG